MLRLPWKAPSICGAHPEELGLQQTLHDLVAAFPLGLLLQDALQEDLDLSDLNVCWEQIDGLGLRGRLIIK